MQKIMKLFPVFCLLFSLQAFSQNTDKSQHPILDKYYPRTEQNTDTNKAVKTQINSFLQSKPAQATTTLPAATSKPSLNPLPVPEVPTPEPATTTTTVPAITTTSSVTTAPDATTVTAGTPKPVFKADTVTNVVPVKKIVQPTSPPAPVYIDTRLGSSTPAYDTWKKNNNGAGSVTTSPK